jgi:hypothetical protein
LSNEITNTRCRTHDSAAAHEASGRSTVALSVLIL